MPKPNLTKREMHHYEESARILRARVGVNPYEPFDPLAMTSGFGALLKYPDELKGLPKAFLAGIQALDAKEWSGISNKLSNGKLFVVLNRHQTLERARVTFLEEVAHEYYGHTPVEIGPDGRKQYHSEQEKEAKFTAAAALLPSKAVALAVYRGESAEQIAKTYGASTELAEMRIKTLNLWEHRRQRVVPKAA